MALLDHFHPPLSVSRHWHAFHNAWATYLASDLNQRLPEGYFVEANVQFGIEIDVATFEEGGLVLGGGAGEGWMPPGPTQTIPFSIMTDTAEVLIYHREGGPTLAGAIELVSPANKDREAHRDAFVSRCVAYLQQGIGLLIVDIVTGRRASLHNALIARLDASAPTPVDTGLYASSYRPVIRDDRASLDIWLEELDLGRPLPLMPLWLPGALCLPVDLDATYERTCREQRIGVVGSGIMTKQGLPLFY